MIKKMNQLKGQSLLEYSLLIIIVAAVFLSMKDYVKRGIQGRWKASVDDLGDQYDPRSTNMFMNHVLTTSSNTFVDVVPAAGGQGFWTKRIDVSNTVETKGSQGSVGPAP
jgi:Flp pilus assembly pilin Flp